MYNKSTKKGPNVKLDVPPQDVNIEKAVLGCVILENATLHKIIDLIQPDTFYHPSNNKIWQACLDLFAKGKPIESMTIWNWLRAKDLNSEELSPEYMLTLTDGVVNTTGVEDYARMIEEKAIGRRVIRINAEFSARVYRDDEDINELLAEMDKQLHMAKRSLSTYKNITSAYIGDKVLASIALGMSTGGVIGVPTGVAPLDKIMGGLRKGRLYLIGARTRMGKSAVAAAFAYNSIKNGRPCIMFSLEMSDEEFYIRLASMRVRDMGHYIPYSRIDRGQISPQEWEIIQQAIGELKQEPIFIDDTSALTPLLFKSKLLQAISEYGVESVYMDYVQLVKNEEKYGQNSAENISNIMTELKVCSKDLQIPVVVLSQVGRTTETNGQMGRPTIANLKGSGSLEEKSDVILLIYRPEVNDPDPFDENGQSEKKIMYIDLAKNKMGETGLVKVKFDVSTNYFESRDFEEIPLPTAAASKVQVITLTQQELFDLGKSPNKPPF